MEAKDTVISDKQLMELAQVPPEDYGAPPYWWLKANIRVAQAQAEISFKVGVMESYPDGFLDGGKVGKKAGIEEVVEWIKETFNKDITLNQMLATNACQEKLKEWGLDESV